jgi:hypothetical protein
MTTLPSWTTSDWTSNVAEPFRSDRSFWTSLAASADALISLGIAIVAAVVLVVTGERAWSFLPFLVPAVLAARAALIGRASSRRSQAAFEDRQAWRVAERSAVAASFGQVLRRRGRLTRI